MTQSPKPHSRKTAGHHALDEKIRKQTDHKLPIELETEIMQHSHNQLQHVHAKIRDH